MTSAKVYKAVNALMPQDATLLAVIGMAGIVNTNSGTDLVATFAAAKFPFLDEIGKVEHGDI